MAWAGHLDRYATECPNRLVPLGAPDNITQGVEFQMRNNTRPRGLYPVALVLAAGVAVTGCGGADHPPRNASETKFCDTWIAYAQDVISSTMFDKPQYKWDRVHASWVKLNSLGTPKKMNEKPRKAIEQLIKIMVANSSEAAVGAKFRALPAADQKAIEDVNADMGVCE